MEIEKCLDYGQGYDDTIVELFKAFKKFSDEMYIKVVMSRREMFEIIEMVNKINRKLQKMERGNYNGNSKN